MDIKKRLQEFNKRFDFIEDSTYEEEFKKFKTRVLNIFAHIDYGVSPEGIALFCRILGIPEVWHSRYMSSYSENIIDELRRENDEKKFYRILQIIFSFIPIKTDYDTGFSRDKLISQISEAIEFSNINLSITISEENVIFYPRGEKALDKLLVNDIFSFLNEESQKHFIDALNFYLNYSIENSIKSAEGIRRSIEEFLRFKLQNHKGLKENIEELQKKLKSDKRDSNLRNIIFQTFSYLDSYFNENSKHKDGNIDESENEFLIYQSGLLMRYIHKVMS